MVSCWIGLLSTAMAADTVSPAAQAAIALLDSTDPYQRAIGFLRLEALREPATLPAIERYTNASDNDIRAASLRAVAAIQGEGAIPRLCDIAQHDRAPRVRRAVLLGLEPLESAAHPELLRTFLDALRDRAPVVRMTAVDIVSRIDHPLAKEAILRRHRRERHRDVQRVLDLAMKRLGYV